MTEAEPKQNAPNGRAFAYDAFISYRKAEPDRTFARRLLRKLEGQGIRVAIDERDFDPSAHFLQEMERCVKQSRYTLAILSPQYLDSGNCEAEAVICTVLDMSERRRRLIPLVIEPVRMPIWLYAIVGINFTDRAPLVDPFQKLFKKLETD